MHLFRRVFIVAGVLLSAAGGASAQLADQVGSNHPASGAYSEVGPSTWGASTWPRGAAFTSGAGSTLEVGVYSANATNVILEIYMSDTGADFTYDYAMVKGGDNVWRAAVADVPNLALYAFRAWGPNWPFASGWARGNSDAGYISDCDACLLYTSRCV